jgi:hypothetical protein
MIRHCRHRKITHHAALVLAALLPSPLLLGCSGKASVHRILPVTTASAPQASSTVIAASPSTTSPLTSTVPVSVGAKCRPSQLRLAMTRDLPSLMQQPAAYFSFTNISGRACTLLGYPGFELLDSHEKPIPLTIHRSGAYQIDDPGPQPVSLEPGGVAYFGFGWTIVNESNSSAECPRAREARAIPPDTTTQLRTNVIFQDDVCPPNGIVTAIGTRDSFRPSQP